MGLFTRTFIIAILFLNISTTWSTAEEDATPLKISKNFYPKKYQQIPLKKYREPTTTTAPDNEPTTERTLETSSEPPEGTMSPDEVNLEDLSDSEKEFLEAMSRTRKSATTTFCVEIRPSNPYQKPFQVCEPAVPQYGYGYKPPRPHPRPMYHPVPYGGSSSFGSQQSFGSSSSYGVQPSYGGQSSYGGQHEPQPQPEGGSGDGYEHPVMVLPHVPVAEPYHVPKPIYKPSSGGGSVYRSSMDSLEAEELDSLDGNARSAYYNQYNSYGEKTPIFDMHKKKEISYLPLITHSYSKTKPLKYLKVLKDLKKDKYKIDDEDYYRPIYYRPPPSSYGQQEEESRKEGGSSSHGLVITCQPSAVGYTGQQSQMELSKHMALLKNIYAQSEKLYNQQSLSSNSASEMSGGYVSPGTYRNADGSSGKPGGYKGAEAEENMRKSGGYKGAEAEENMRKSGGWKGAEAEENMRKSGGWKGAEAEENMRKSGGWKGAEENMRKSGGKYKIDDQVAMALSSSAGPNPTSGMMVLGPTSSFSNSQNQFAFQD